VARSSRANLWLGTVAFGLALVVLGIIAKLAKSIHESDAVVRTDNRILEWFIDRPEREAIAPHVAARDVGMIVRGDAPQIERVDVLVSA